MKIVINVFCVLALVFPMTTFAQWYVGATGGQYELDIDNWEWNDSLTISTRGGYRFNRFLSLEGSYVFFSESESTTNYTTLEGGLFDIGLVGTIPLGKHFEIFGRAGLGYWAANVDDWGYNSDDTGSLWNYGGGFAINFNRNWSLFAGYQKYDFDVDSEDLSADTVYAGVKFYFDFTPSNTKSSTVTPTASYEQQPTPVSNIQLREVSEADKQRCEIIETVTGGSGGAGTPSNHMESAMNMALGSAERVGADSYFVVKIESNGAGASAVLEALNCN